MPSVLVTHRARDPPIWAVLVRRCRALAAAHNSQYVLDSRHITDLAAGSEWFEVADAALLTAGLAAAGIAVLRRAAGWAAGQAAQAG
jgi:hypothetical protein